MINCQQNLSPGVPVSFFTEVRPVSYFSSGIGGKLQNTVKVLTFQAI